MEIPKRLIDCLNENNVTYEILHHPEAVTAQRIAQAEHVKGRHHAKVVMIKSGEQSAAPSHSTGKRNSSRSSQTARSARCRPLGISMVCRPMWIKISPSRT